MKKTFLILSIFTLLLSSCLSDDKYEKYNTDTKNPTEVDPAFLFNSAEKSLVDQMTNTNVNRNIYRLLAQYWTETTYIDEANYDFTERNIPQNHWSEMYRDVLLDLTNAKQLILASNKPTLTEADKISSAAQAEILMIYTWQQLVDSFGDIPYSEALGDVTLPKYDDAATIYIDLISRLNTAIPNLTTNGFDEADKLYNGDPIAWTKFANSLKLKLGIRIADLTDMQTLSETTIQDAVSDGVFTSNSDNAAYVYESSVNTNPVWDDLVQSGRNDFVAANTIVDIMNTLNDPRRPVYFEENLGADTYQGGSYGLPSSFTTNSHPGSAMYSPTNPACLIDYAEVSFFLAEAAERTIVGSPTDAEMHYNNAITASFNYWGITDNAVVTGYLGNLNVDYTTAPGTWREKIGTQFWLAMYNRGFEGWTVWRKYDAPTMNIPGDTGNPVPFRYTYPVNEQNLNTTNWELASTAIGGDAQSTKVFWDIN